MYIIWNFGNIIGEFQNKKIEKNQYLIIKIKIWCYYQFIIVISLITIMYYYFMYHLLRIIFLMSYSVICCPIIKILLIYYWFWIAKLVGVISKISSTPYNEYMNYSSLQNSNPLILIIFKPSSHNI